MNRIAKWRNADNTVSDLSCSISMFNPINLFQYVSLHFEFLNTFILFFRISPKLVFGNLEKGLHNCYGKWHFVVRKIISTSKNGHIVWSWYWYAGKRNCLPAEVTRASSVRPKQLLDLNVRCDKLQIGKDNDGKARVRLSTLVQFKYRQAHIQCHFCIHAGCRCTVFSVNTVCWHGMTNGRGW